MTTTTAADSNNNRHEGKEKEKKLEGGGEEVVPPPMMKELTTTNDGTTDDDDKDKQKMFDGTTTMKAKKGFIKQATKTTQKGIHQVTSKTQKGIQHATKTTQKGIQKATKTTQKGIQQVTKKAVHLTTDSTTKTPLLGGRRKSQRQKNQDDDIIDYFEKQAGENNNPMMKNYDATTTTTKHGVEESKNLAKASPIDVKSSITLEENQKALAITVTEETNTNIYNQRQNTTTTLYATNSIFTMPADEVVPRLLVILVGIGLTFGLYWDAIINKGLVPVYLIPLWFILGIFVCQLFLSKPAIINVLSTTGATTTGGGRGEEVDEFARRSPRKTLQRYETPIDEGSVAFTDVEPQKKKKSTRTDFFKYVRIDKLLFSKQSNISNNSTITTTTRRNYGHDNDTTDSGGHTTTTNTTTQHKLPTISTSDFTKYFTNLSGGGKNNKKQHKKNVFWSNLAENNGELMDYLLLNFTGMGKKKKQKSSKKDDGDNHHDDDEDAPRPEEGKAAEEVEEDAKGRGEGVIKTDSKDSKDHTTTSDTDTTMGHVTTENTRAHKLEKDMVIDPLFTLRGIDVFRPNGPAEEKIWRQPILEENGLFDVPTFVINVMLPWYNFVLYFQMPDWVTNFNDITEHPDDPEDTIALKRFLKGDTEYREPRWKIVPCLVNGPFVIKAIAPAKTAIAIGRPGRLPVTWHQYDEQVCPETGKVTRCALLEADCDLCSDPAIRKILGIVKGQIPRCTIDCALIIDKPWDSKTPEPSACIGLWRLDKINMDVAAIIPEKDETQLLQEFITILPEGNELSKSIRNLLEKQKQQQEESKEVAGGGGRPSATAAAAAAPGITVQA